MLNPRKLCLFILVLLAFLPVAYAPFSYDPAKGLVFTFPAYSSAMGFTSAQVFTNVTRIGNFWYFDGNEFSIQNGNLNVSRLFTGNIFSAYVLGGAGALATVTVMSPSFTSAPSAVTSSSAVVVQVLTSVDFLGSAVSCWFFDTVSFRTYVKVLISGVTSLSIDYNAAPALPVGPGPGPGPVSTSSVQVADCSVTVPSGGSRVASLLVSWNFFGNVTLTGISFQGNQASWTHNPTVPLVLSIQANSIPVTIAVPNGHADGTYTIQVNSVFSYLGGSQSIRSSLIVTVGSVGSDFWAFLAPAGAGWNVLVAWAALNLSLLLMSISMITAVIVVAVVVRSRR